jgi:hypothetical protein
MIKTKRFGKLYEEIIREGMEEFYDYDDNIRLQKNNYNLFYKNKKKDFFKKLKKDLTYENIFNLEKKLNLEKETIDYGYLNPKIIKKLFKSIKKYKKIYKNL